MSGITMGTGLLIGGLAGAGGGIASGIMGANAAGDAASAQANAADQAAQLQYQASQNALDFQKQQYNTSQQEMAPWLRTGQGALSNLAYLMGIGSPGAYQGAPGLQSESALPAPSGPNAPPQPSFGAPLAGTGVSQPTFGGFQSGAQRNPGGPITGLSPMGASAPSSGVVGAVQNGGQAAPLPGSGARLTAPPGVSAPTSGAVPAMQNPAAGGNPSLAGGFGSLMEANPYSTFSAPTAAQMEANDPGYQERLKLAQTAMENSAAARGNVLTGGTAQAENQMAQDYASNEYNNYYNQAFNTNAANYNAFNQNQANEYNRLANMAGMGQTTAGQLANLGTEMSGQVGSNLLGTANAMGQQYNNAAAANASGMVGAANAYGGAINGATGGLMNLMLMRQLMGGGGGGVPQVPDSMFQGMMG